MPPIALQLPTYPSGLVLITGETGSGKSTTLAAVLNRINHTAVSYTHLGPRTDPFTKSLAVLWTFCTKYAKCQQSTLLARLGKHGSSAESRAVRFHHAKMKSKYSRAHYKMPGPLVCGHSRRFFVYGRCCRFRQHRRSRPVSYTHLSLGAIFITKCKCTCRSGGIGRRTGLKILRSLPIVPVRPRSPAPICR